MKNDEDDVDKKAKRAIDQNTSEDKSQNLDDNNKDCVVKPLEVLMNGGQEEPSMVSETNTSVSSDSASGTAQATENDDTQLEMITLGSNNNVFMTTKALHGQPIYSSKELPTYLQNTLEESLSKITISDNDICKEIQFCDYQSEKSLPDLTALITKDLSEPYSIYTYRYFLHNWPQLSFLVSINASKCGSIIIKGMKKMQRKIKEETKSNSLNLLHLYSKFSSIYAGKFMSFLSKVILLIFF